MIWSTSHESSALLRSL